jgi:hypothetical protein
VTTQALIAELQTMTRQVGFRTSLLVLGSCEGTIEALPPELPLALVATDGRPLPIAPFPLARVFDSGAPTLARVFVAGLTPEPFEVADPAALPARRWRARLASVTRVAPWFIPFALWVVGFAWWRRRSRALKLSVRVHPQRGR